MGKQLARLPLAELGKPEQGFICQRGDFMSRQEAWQVAKAAGQLRREVVDDIDGDNGRLYSENLY